MENQTVRQEMPATAGKVLQSKEIQDYVDAFGVRPKNGMEGLTKKEKAQLERYKKAPVTRKEYDEMLEKIGDDYGRVLISAMVMEKIIIREFGEEKYKEVKGEVLNELYGEVQSATSEDTQEDSKEETPE